MPCSSIATKLANACTSGISKIQSKVKLLQIIAGNICENDIPPSVEWLTSLTAGTNNGYSGTLGHTFTVGASNITVTALGCYVPAGGSQIHKIAISDTACAADLAVVMMDFTGLSGPSYIDITPIVLLAGQTYQIYLRAFFGGDDVYNITPTFTTTAAATLGRAKYGGAACANTDYTIGSLYVGASFKYR